MKLTFLHFLRKMTDLSFNSFEDETLASSSGTPFSRSALSIPLRMKHEKGNVVFGVYELSAFNSFEDETRGEVEEVLMDHEYLSIPLRMKQRKVYDRGMD